MSIIKCERTNCEFNKEKVCTTDIEIYENGCLNYKEKESSIRSKFTYKNLKMKDLGEFTYVIKHNIYISLNQILDILSKDETVIKDKIIVDCGYSNGLKSDNRFICLSFKLNEKKKCDMNEIFAITDKKVILFLSVETRKFFYNHQDLIDGSIWCEKEKDYMRKTGYEIIKEHNKNR